MAVAQPRTFRTTSAAASAASSPKFGGSTASGSLALCCSMTQLSANFVKHLSKCNWSLFPWAGLVSADPVQASSGRNPRAVRSDGEHQPESKCRSGPITQHTRGPPSGRPMAAIIRIAPVAGPRFSLQPNPHRHTLDHAAGGGENLIATCLTAAHFSGMFATSCASASTAPRERISAAVCSF